MNPKHLFQSLMLSTLVALAASVTPAQALRQRGCVGYPTTRPATPAAVDNHLGAESPAAPEAAQDSALPDLIERQRKAIAGSWFITLGCGCKFLFSFTSDGIFSEVGQGDIQPVGSPIPSATAGYGTWMHNGGRQFAVTFLIIGYDIQSGEFKGTLKVRINLTLNEAGDQLSGVDKADIFDPDGHLVDSFTTGTMHGARIKVEPLD